MKVVILNIAGYEEALYGLGLSYGLTSKFDNWKDCPAELKDRMISISSRLAHKTNGEGKFLEHIILWLKVTAPRYWWQEADTYRLSSKQSESTMHTFAKEMISPEMIIDSCEEGSCTLEQAIRLWHQIRVNANISEIKRRIPEGFIQTREWCMSASTLRRIIEQRKEHRLQHWRTFIDQILEQINIEYKELITL